MLATGRIASPGVDSAPLAMLGEIYSKTSIGVRAEVGIDSVAQTFSSSFGFQDVIFDITQALSETPLSVHRVEMIFVDPDENVQFYSVDVPVGLIPSDRDLFVIEMQFWRACETNAIGGDTVERSFVGVRHEFTVRGENRVGLRFHYGSQGEWVSTSEATLIHVGDGFRQDTDGL